MDYLAPIKYELSEEQFNFWTKNSIDEVDEIKQLTFKEYLSLLKQRQKLFELVNLTAKAQGEYISFNNKLYTNFEAIVFDVLR